MACSIDLDLWGVVGQNMQSMASVAKKTKQCFPNAMFQSQGRNVL